MVLGQGEVQFCQHSDNAISVSHAANDAGTGRQGNVERTSDARMK